MELNKNVHKSERNIWYKLRFLYLHWCGDVEQVMFVFVGGTYTDKALKFARTESFTPANGARFGVPKILVVLTDGQSSSPTNTVLEGRILHFSDIRVNQYTTLGITIHSNQPEQTNFYNKCPLLKKQPSAWHYWIDFHRLYFIFVTVSRPLSLPR